MSEATVPKKGFNPGLRLIALAERWAPGIRPRLQKSIIRGVYQRLNTDKYLGDVTFMNYGYAALSDGDAQSAGDLTGEEQPWYLSIQLYAKVTAPVDLAGKDLLEVGCGPGGGSNFLHRVRSPRSATGLDFSARAVSSAGQRYRRPGLRFLAADAEKLPFPPASFDAVVNVESSHCYPDIPTFFAEVHRVLRPGGHFLFADFRLADGIAALLQELTAAGLVLLEDETITPNVVRSLELDSARRTERVEQKFPSYLRKMGKNFVAAEGSNTLELFRTGGLEYHRFLLQKS